MYTRFVYSSGIALCSLSTKTVLSKNSRRSSYSVSYFSGGGNLNLLSSIYCYRSLYSSSWIRFFRNSLSSSNIFKRYFLRSRYALEYKFCFSSLVSRCPGCMSSLCWFLCMFFQIFIGEIGSVKGRDVDSGDKLQCKGA